MAIADRDSAAVGILSKRAGATAHWRDGIPTSLLDVCALSGRRAAVTQLGECKTEDLEVAGSSPACGTLVLSEDLQ